MKNFAIRTSVLALALAGFASTSIISSASASSSRPEVKTSVVMTPTPMCPPGDKNGCGID
jgi:hypothetical protein